MEMVNFQKIRNNLSNVHLIIFNMSIVSIDGLFTDHQLGVTVRHCLKVYSCVRDKWLLFCCRTAEEKRRWLAAMAEERRLVAQDRNDGLEFPSAARQLARLAATRQQNRPPIKPRSTYNNYRLNLRKQVYFKPMILL